MASNQQHRDPQTTNNQRNQGRPNTGRASASDATNGAVPEGSGTRDFFDPDWRQNEEFGTAPGINAAASLQHGRSFGAIDDEDAWFAGYDPAAPEAGRLSHGAPPN